MPRNSTDDAFAQLALNTTVSSADALSAAMRDGARLTQRQIDALTEAVRKLSEVVTIARSRRRSC